ncbi:mitochondrial intermembrane space import and assembly protein 40 [Onthophagus taurus]|uniref:mitochondrial intermembrane space import and assembly protein 40 n=1 Tax=Onthophagus taurus TaxID=166361 RepID=UPI000C20F472|nr:mitochondrial intermembrane space import and assembly protein 40 [Onthophagus taurus]XP_022911794.1 mitochondrial intermembrane space import and assembly protein 40 [Onthophagus taurus]XP_022911795.1 mitochondrial intermembrane space import and assembly protein 40 [Onthophagus taurus]
MSHCRRMGPNKKDIVIFATEEDHKIPSKVTLPEIEQQPGLILANGDINWNCPCLGGMATGPCGVEFRKAFSCFHHSTAEPKGSDCFDLFKTMQTCMRKFPALYSKDMGEDDDLPLPDEATKIENEHMNSGKKTK